MKLIGVIFPDKPQSENIISSTVNENQPEPEYISIRKPQAPSSSARHPATIARGTPASRRAGLAFFLPGFACVSLFYCVQMLISFIF